MYEVKSRTATAARLPVSNAGGFGLKVWDSWPQWPNPTTASNTFVLVSETGPFSLGKLYLGCVPLDSQIETFGIPSRLWNKPALPGGSKYQSSIQGV